MPSSTNHTIDTPRIGVLNEKLNGQCIILFDRREHYYGFNRMPKIQSDSSNFHYLTIFIIKTLATRILRYAGYTEPFFLSLSRKLDFFKSKKKKNRPYQVSWKIRVICRSNVPNSNLDPPQRPRFDGTPPNVSRPVIRYGTHDRWRNIWRAWNGPKKYSIELYCKGIY